MYKGARCRAVLRFEKENFGGNLRTQKEGGNPFPMQLFLKSYCLIFLKLYCFKILIRTTV